MAAPTTQKAYKAIRNVLAGLDAEGAAPITAKIPFSRHIDRRVIAAQILARLIAQLGHVYRQHHLTWLTVKLLAHLCKHHTEEPLRANDLPTAPIAEALIAKPSLIGGRAGFDHILRHFTATRPNILTERAKAPVTPRRVIWRDPPYTLTEVTHPRHLREDGFALRHCTANVYDLALLGAVDRVRPATTSESLFALGYWRAIENGHLRILTLMENDQPRVTIQYSCGSWNITNIQALEPISGRSRLLPPLCRALHAFRGTTRVVDIFDLPLPNDGMSILTTEGTYLPATQDNFAQALVAHIVPDKHTPLSTLEWLTQQPKAALILSYLPQKLLNCITDVRGTLALHLSTIRLPKLRSIGGHFNAGRASAVDLPRLETIGASNLCRHATTINQPRLTTIAGNNICSSAQFIDQTRLTSIGGVNAFLDTATVSQPALRHVGRHTDDPHVTGRHVVIRPTQHLHSIAT
ncbi:hypothetical protein [Hyphomicrobium sp. CS1BSMeth3]|uniref:hypothetical protein n=1 Tax=Hyphomicrobium sp. CS1BSMeth3 TaxID=1892844 RepID=UPI00093142C6|nr:hypothetical protein [Hyphomicrobium sp. CS1BSMeth3]